MEHFTTWVNLILIGIGLNLVFKSYALSYELSMLRKVKNEVTGKKHEEFQLNYFERKLIPVELCGIVENKKVAIELGELEIVNLYQANKTDNNMVLNFTNHSYFFIKNGKITTHQKDNVISKLNGAHLLAGEYTYLFKEGVFLTNRNCSRIYL